jgi:hypothetical protein
LTALHRSDATSEPDPGSDIAIDVTAPGDNSAEHLLFDWFAGELEVRVGDDQGDRSY